MKTVMLVYGTRPEAIKLAPIVQALRTSHLRPFTVSTGQHRDMLEPVHKWFKIEPNLDLNLFAHGQSLTELSARIMAHLPRVIRDVRPDAVVVQGDTTSVAMAAIAAFYEDVPVVHVEAGLRSGDLRSPFPEEANRRLAGQVASLHLAPTMDARTNLLRENVQPGTICVTGNTVIDALLWSVGKEVSFSDSSVARAVSSNRPIVLLTTHRRENWGPPMSQIGRALAILARQFPEVDFIFPAHVNPQVRDAVRPEIEGLSNVIMCEPLSYPEFVNLQKRSTVILTDSGGVQEEAPSLGKPVLVLRENTERPEALEAGTVKLIGTDTRRIVAETSNLLKYGGQPDTVNPYGDGRAAERSVAAIAHLLGVGSRLEDFRAGQA